MSPGAFSFLTAAVFLIMFLPMDRLYKLLFLLLFSLLTPLALHSTQSVTCTPSLQRHLDAILNLPDAQHLLDTIRKEGPIYIVSKYNVYSHRFKAFWDPATRIINIDLSTLNTDGLIIGYLLLELHNAATNGSINHLNELAKGRKISKKMYVESIEYLEYVNAIKASNLAKIGINMGLFTRDSSLPTFASFEEHLTAQKLSGHSACYEYNYDKYSNYKIIH